MTWDDLEFWQTGEWQVLQERLEEYEGNYHPSRELLFAGLDICPLETVKVMIMGQDPYPDPRFATGVAFSIPKDARTFPPTLLNILKEYQNDLHYPMPTTGNLDRWCKQGVLLLNAQPVYYCLEDKYTWRMPEWDVLNKEIIQVLNQRDKLCVFLGQRASRYSDDRSITLSHPSPLASSHARNPFLGSRIFTTINCKLVELGLDPINWRLG